MADLLTRQEELESLCLAEGAKRFRERIRQASEKERLSTVAGGRKLLRQGLEPMIAGMEHTLAAPKKGRPHMALKWVREVGPEVAAFLTLRVVVDGFALRKVARAVALDIAELILHELAFRRFKQERPEQFQYALQRFNTSSYLHKARSLRAQATQQEIDLSDLDLGPADRMRLGMWCLNLLIETTGLAEMERSFSPRRHAGDRVRREIWVVPTAQTVEWLTRHHDVLEALLPVNLPMLVAPRPWGPGQRGGYLFGLKDRYPLVRGASREHTRNVGKADLPVIHRALNAVQETGWRVNADILEVARQLAVSLGGGVAGIPVMREMELPPKPHDIATNPESREAWKKAAGKVRNQNRETRIQQVGCWKTLEVASRFKDEVFYFPHNIDFRGRLYPMTAYLTPQGDDLQRGLLCFAEGKALGADGWKWLRVHGANALGEFRGVKVSRLSFGERVALIDAHADVWRSIARNPVENLDWWQDADEPFQFLAFCLEYAAATSGGDPEAFVSSLPVSVDGSCNGIQHFSALWRDEVGGAAVNMLPSERPRDLYRDVADEVGRLLEQRAQEGNELAALWLASGIVDRKIAKRPTMTFGYGSNVYGFKSQILEEMRKDRERFGRLREHFGFDERTRRDGKVIRVSRIGKAASLLAETVWLALSRVVVAAFSGREWLRACAKAINKTDAPVEWTVPATGLCVRQEYYNSRKQQINTILAGQVIKPCVYHDQAGVLPHRQVNAIAPNVVHSLDAAALCLTVCAAQDAGLSSFMMIHDSYGTLAADMETLQQVTRRAFVELYTNHNVVEELERQFRAQAGPYAEEIPPAPPMGGLDLGQVVRAPYFFA